MPARPPIGLSLHIGINRIDPAHYGTSGTLQGCERDAQSMQELALAAGFVPGMLLSEAARSETVLRWIAAAAAQLEAGDVFLLTYSGHGGRVRDINGDEAGGKDSTWCLYDRMVVDDELWDAWRAFRSGVRIVVVADSCHSGTSVKAILPGEELDPEERDPNTLFPMGTPIRELPGADLTKAYKDNKPMYDEIFGAVRSPDAAPVVASVLLLAACQDNQTASDGDDTTNLNGLYTFHLLSRLAQKPASYRLLHNAVLRVMPANQSPNLYQVGAPAAGFEHEAPFSIGTAPFAVRAPGAGLAAVTTGGVNFRSEPRVATSTKIRELAAGTQLVAVGNEGEWLQVRIGNETGFVSVRFAQTVAGAVGSFSTTATTGLNLRALPSADSARVGGVVQGESLEVRGWSPEVPWLSVKVGALEGFVKAEYTRGLAAVVTDGDGPLDSAGIRALRGEIDSGDPGTRAARYEALQARVRYLSQRDNQARLGGQKIEVESGAMCNLTSLAMALTVLGIDNPKPDRQYEDALEELRQANGYAARTTAQGWGAVARAMGADARFLASADAQLAESWWRQVVLPELRLGNGVIMSITGHIVRVEAVRADGLVVDDPYGKCRLLPGAGRSWLAKNPYDAPGAVGDSVVWPWADVAAHTTHWVAAIVRGTRDLETFLTPLPDLRDDANSGDDLP